MRGLHGLWKGTARWLVLIVESIAILVVQQGITVIIMIEGALKAVDFRILLLSAETRSATQERRKLCVQRIARALIIAVMVSVAALKIVRFVHQIAAAARRFVAITSVIRVKVGRRVPLTVVAQEVSATTTNNVN